MQLSDVFCYAVLTIAMAATCVQAEGELNELEERHLDKRISRRTSTLIVDGTPVERMFQKPKVIYRRVSKKRYPLSRTTRGPPRPKYGPPRSARKPAKKYRSKPLSKRTPSSHKKRAPKPRYGPPSKRPTMKPVYGPPKNNPHRQQYQSEHSGFGEPPNNFNKHRPMKNNDYYSTNFENDLSKPDFGNSFASKPDFAGEFSSKPNHNTGPDFSSPASFINDFSHPSFGGEFPAKPQFGDYPNSNHNYGEPPVDSYGAPVKSNLHDLTFSTVQSFLDSASHLDEDNSGPDTEQWTNFKDQKQDNSYAYSKKQLSFSMPDSEVYVTPVPQAHNEEQYLKSYSDIYNYRQMKNNNKKKKVNYMENVKIVNKPWKGNKMKVDSDEEIIVGGQYAEPPARYVPKFQPSAPMHNHDDSVFSPPLSFSDPDAASSATMSSYVNYKNSNMAFSPQNLNDAFSIVDK